MSSILSKKFTNKPTPKRVRDSEGLDFLGVPWYPIICHVFLLNFFFDGHFNIFPGSINICVRKPSFFLNILNIINQCIPTIFWSFVDPHSVPILVQLCHHVFLVKSVTSWNPQGCALNRTQKIYGHHVSQKIAIAWRYRKTIFGPKKTYHMAL